MIVIIVAALCCMAKCNFSLMTKRRKRKLRIAERKKSMKARANQPAVTETVSRKAEVKKEEKKVMAISKSNPQTNNQIKPKSKNDLIIDIIDSALGGDVSDTEFLNYSSSESIDRCEEEQVRRASCASLTLSLVFDTKTNLPIFRRL